MIKKETIDLHSWLFETFFHVYETKTYVPGILFNFAAK